MTQDEHKVSDLLFRYYALMKAGFLDINQMKPDGFQHLPEHYVGASNIPVGLIIKRPWRLLGDISFAWRNQLKEQYQNPQITNLLQDGLIKPILFSDVDLAVIDIQAQEHVDQYVADRATLEALGFVAQFYHDLSDPNIKHGRIGERNDLKFSSHQQSKEFGQELFHSALIRIQHERQRLVNADFDQRLNELLIKQPWDLTDEDYRDALENIKDAFYVLIVDPLSGHISQGKDDIVQVGDVQSGQDRMKIIYSTIAAYSSSQFPREEMIRHRTFGDMNPETHFYPGVEDLFKAVRSHGIDVVGISRGNQFPLTTTVLGELFTRVHCTLLAAHRSSYELDPTYPDKKIHPDTQLLDHMSTEDKVRIIIHESLGVFRRAGLEFDNPGETLGALATYLDSCLFVSDSDLEVWGTCPFVTVLSLHTPTQADVMRVFSEADKLPEPILVINPGNRDARFHGLAEKTVLSDFDSNHPAIERTLGKLIQGKELLERS